MIKRADVAGSHAAAQSQKRKGRFRALLSYKDTRVAALRSQDILRRRTEREKKTGGVGSQLEFPILRREEG